MAAVVDDLKGRSFTRVADWSRPELEHALDLAAELKREPLQPLLPGRTIALIFHKPSTRTRVSFAVGIYQLGGLALPLASGDLQLRRGETVRDTATVLSRYVDAIVIRTPAQADVDGLAEHATVPVINALTEDAHPCQVLADLLTMRERAGALDGARLVYLGDGNNMCNSLLVGAATFGMHVVAATPASYRPAQRAVAIAETRARASGGSVTLTDDAHAAVAGADFLYTDVWTSMGQEEESARRRADFRGFGIDAELLAAAGEQATVLHCLPAHYDEEITEDVVYGPQSAVFDEAENRLHAQKALMALVIR